MHWAVIGQFIQKYISAIFSFLLLNRIMFILELGNSFALILFLRFFPQSVIARQIQPRELS